MQVFYVFFGCVAGYISARLYKSKFESEALRHWFGPRLLEYTHTCTCTFAIFIRGHVHLLTRCQPPTTHTHTPVVGGLRWKTNVLMTAFFVPGITFGVFFILNLFLWGAGSSAAIPFTTLLALLCLWFGVSLPLTFFGSFLGFRKAVSSPYMLSLPMYCQHAHLCVSWYPWSITYYKWTINGHVI